MTFGFRNGMCADQAGGTAWRKSSHSGKLGNCVELGWSPGQAVLVRNSRDPHGPVLVYPLDRMIGFLGAATDGELR